MSTSRLGNLVMGLGVAALLIGLVDVALSRKGPRHFLPEQKMAESTAKAKDCVLLLGDSRMAAGYAEDGFRAGSARAGAPTCSIDLALGGTDIRGAYLTARRFFRLGGRAGVAALGISADSLLDPETPLDPQEMVGNNAIHLIWSDASDVFTEYPGFPFLNIRAFDDGWRFLISRATALGRFQSLIWLQVQKVQGRLAGAPQEDRNAFGRLADMHALEVTFRTRARDRIGSVAHSGGGEIAPMTWFTKLSDVLLENQVPFVTVELPMRAQFRSEVLETETGRVYRAWLDGVLAERGVRHLDLSHPDWLDDRLFADPLHLNASGARLFSEDLAEQLTRAGRP